jgi:hypothetical protein
MAFATERECPRDPRDRNFCDKDVCEACGGIWNWKKDECKKYGRQEFKCDDGWKAFGHSKIVYAAGHYQCKKEETAVIDVCFNLHPNFNQDGPDFKKMPTTVPCEQHCWPVD